MSTETKHLGYADEYSKIDLLGNNKYYDGLSDFIINCETPMTISIQGDWGSGKTTALNLIQKKIEEKKPCKNNILWFNTWQYSKFGMENNMTLALMSNLHNKLKQLAKEKKIKTDNINLDIKSFLPTVISAATNKLAGEEAASSLETLTKELMGIDYIVDSSKKIEETKNNIQKCINAIVGEDERLIIFIDDLDRLEPRIAIELLEGLKIFLDCKKCVYVLAIDASVVYQGVKSKYGDEFGIEKSKKYFDKIIQVPFNLPVNQYNLSQYVTQFISDTDTPEKYVKIITKLLECNPRSIKRAFNLLQLYELIMADNIKDSTDKLNLFAIILFQIKNESAYSELVNAAKNSSETIYQTLNKEEYALIKEALNLEPATMDDENWIAFIELLVNTSQVSISSPHIASEAPIRYEKPEDFVTGILDKLNPALTKQQINNNVINYLDENNNKLCSFRINNGTLNIVIYSKPSEKTVSLPKSELLIAKNNKNNYQISSSQLGYYHSPDHITFVDIQKCQNVQLIDEIMHYYSLY